MSTNFFVDFNSSATNIKDQVVAKNRGYKYFLTLCMLYRSDNVADDLYNQHTDRMHHSSRSVVL